MTTGDLQRISIRSIRDVPDHLERAVDWFSSKWGIPRIEYENSFRECLEGDGPIPQWYLLLDGEGRIAGGCGLIENDFVDRTDLSPYLCALYVEPFARGHAFGGLLLDHVRAAAAELGFRVLYLCTDHTQYYERYGWTFLAMGRSSSGEACRIYVSAPMPLARTEKRGPAQETDQERQARIYPVVLREPDPAWAEWYREEKESLERRIGAENIARISHIGSTAVPGLAAKPTVDILLEIAESARVDDLISALPPPEYICLHPPDMPTPPPHLVFLKGYLSDGFAERVYHIHVRYPGDWDELHFRDHLIAHPEIAAEYAELKRRLLQDHEHDRNGYTAAKTEFIRAVTRKAREVSHG